MKPQLLPPALAADILALFHMAEAQQPKRIYRIGMLVTGSDSTHKSRIDAFRQGLHELGYMEGKNTLIEYRYADGKQDRFPELASEMVRLKPDVIVVGSTRFTAAVKQATSTIPIVAQAGDLVGDGLVASLARPGGNVTGSTSISPDLSGKRLELLNEVIPTASRVAVLWDPTNPNNALQLRDGGCSRAIGSDTSTSGGSSSQ